ncbi:MAG: YicC/YloC family endoribonuclease [bacterium]
MRSMTGFGRARVSRDGRFVALEISTVNNRHLDVNFSLKADLELEQKVIDKVKDRIERGNVDVRVESNVLNETEETLDVNNNLVEKYLDIASELRLSSDTLSGDVNVVDLLSLPGVLSLHQKPTVEEEAESMLLEALERALDDVIEMREREGDELAADLGDRIDTIDDKLKSIDDRFPEALEQYRERLREKFDEVLELNESDLNQELENEITKYADKCDISEEIVRVESHINQFRDYLGQDQPVGKNLEFLLQEIQRETNTIGAKGNDAEISQLAVEMKTELEKCREQINNVE